MKRIWQYIAIAALAVSAAACTPEYPVLSSAGLPQASDLDVTISVDQETNYVTFVMNNKGMVPVWIFGDQKIDGKASKKYSYTENGVSLRFRDAGEYTVEVKAYNANGLSQGSQVLSFTLNNTYRDPFDPSPYVKAISGGASVDWVWNSTENGHFGCGPVGNPLGWWSCDANGKKGFLYDDVMTFDSEGNYTFNPGDGQAYANKGSEYKAEYKTADEDYLFQTEQKTSKYTFENNWNDAGIEEIYLVLDSGSELSYVPHKSIVEEPRYQVMETKTSNMKKKIQLMGTVFTPDNPDGISWYYEFVPKGSNPDAADPLFGLESKTWVLDNESAGYMGCGPDFGSSGSWWSAGPHEKDNFGVVDDEITFYANGKYVFDPGEGGMVYCNWESGWRPDGYYSGDGSTDYDAPAERMESTYVLGSDSTGDYIELPAGVLYGYIPKPQVLSETNRLYIKELTANKLFVVANFDGISWQFIYRPKDGQGGGDTPQPDPYDSYNPDVELDVNGAGNLWAAATVTNDYWYADGGWGQISDPEAETLPGNGLKVVIPAGIGGSEWQGQTKFHTDIFASKDKKYDFGITLEADEDNTVTLKLAWEGNDNDNAFFYANDIVLKADMPRTVKFKEIFPKNKDGEAIDYDKVVLFVDLGRTPAGTTVLMKDICLQESTVLDPNSDRNLWKSATVTNDYWYANGGWAQISDPEAETLPGNGLKVVIPDGIGGSEWQGQTKFHTDIPASKDKKYDFAITLEADEDNTLTLKLAWEGNDNDNAFFYRNDVQVKADEPFTFKAVNIFPQNKDGEAIDYDKVVLFVDLGRTPAGTTVAMKDIVFQEH
ncbi:MAG: hypothetical protein IKV62_07520 [Bacteroidales bacterium]|nr:hypothetical protein [Bacteroidales bacterium]